MQISGQVRYFSANAIFDAAKPFVPIMVLATQRKLALLVLADSVFALPLCPMTTFSALICAVAAAPLTGRWAVAGVHHHHHLWEAGPYAGC